MSTSDQICKKMMTRQMKKGALHSKKKKVFFFIFLIKIIQLLLISYIYIIDLEEQKEYESFKAFLSRQKSHNTDDKTNKDS